MNGFIVYFQLVCTLCVRCELYRHAELIVKEGADDCLGSCVATIASPPSLVVVYQPKSKLPWKELYKMCNGFPLTSLSLFGVESFAEFAQFFTLSTAYVHV